MVSLKTLYYGIAKVVNGICDNGYYQDRPASVTDKLNSYIVINLPSAVYNNELGERGEYNDFSTTVVLEVYVRDLVSASNPNGMDIKKMDEKVDAVLKLFPINTKDFKITKPQIIFQTSDKSGFHVTFIQAQLNTK
ncbi:hypothetical protein [Prevotella pallens]|uniref:hypothetical protein n=1 Tax=Prevotella pallens TaxID=60133 RepID=UPI0028EBEE10|nr:hypothetical protein [Prevotella pallens]